MNVRTYFQNIRRVEHDLPAGDVVVISLITPDGGVAGRVMELDRSLAARMIVDGRFRPANQDEVDAYREELQREQEEAESRFIEPRMQMIVAIHESQKKIQQRKKKQGGEDGTVS